MSDLFTDIEEEEIKNDITVSDIIAEVANLTLLNDPTDEVQQDFNDLIKATVEAAALKTILTLRKYGLLNVG